VRVGRHGERLPAFGPRRANPAAAPDQAAGLVVAPPDIPGIRRGDRVDAAAAEEPAEHRWAVPPWCAQPRDCPVRADHGATLPVGDQGVLAQHVRPERSDHERASVRQIPAETPGHARPDAPRPYPGPAVPRPGPVTGPRVWPSPCRAAGSVTKEPLGGPGWSPSNSPGRGRCRWLPRREDSSVTGVQTGTVTTKVPARLDRLLPGTVSQYVLRRTPCPVLVVPEGGGHLQ
jgi:hypothetical protein